ncbi:MAG: ABC transporter permease [Verrucomicrobia bacterium]|nr:ABC transporter permease [Verrucomicrobiota bacterium]
MKRLLFEFIESWRIAYAQLRANRTRSFLTALGVIIGIVAVTLMGTAIGGINTGFERSLSLLGDDILYVSKAPWNRDGDDTEYRNRPALKASYAERLNAIIESTPRTELVTAVPSSVSFRRIKRGDSEVDRVYILGTTDAYAEISAIDFREGRFFTGDESRGGRNVVILGFDVANALFPNESPLEKNVRIAGQEWKVVGVFARQGSFLGLFSFDNQAVLPLPAFQKFFKGKGRDEAEIRVKIKDKNRVQAAQEELVGHMRRLRGIPPGEKENFAVNANEAFKSTLGPIQAGIAIAGLFITGLSLFVGAIGIMNITFVSVKERTKEIGTRKALGARRRTILLQFLIEAVSICVLGGLAGIALSWLMFTAVASAFPSFPISFSMDLVVVGLLISVITGVVSGFAPAWSASKLDPVTALRYE